jgi:hypothetical protein
VFEVISTVCLRQQHLIQISASSTARVFTAYFESLKSAANHCDAERQVKGRVSNQESDLQSAQEKSVLLIQEIEEIFLTVGIPFDKAFFSSANGSVSVLRTLSKDFEMQRGLREKVATKSQLAKERGDEQEIQTMMMRSCFGCQQLRSTQKMPSTFGTPCSGGKRVTYALVP